MHGNSTNYFIADDVRTAVELIHFSDKIKKGDYLRTLIYICISKV